MMDIREKRLYYHERYFELKALKARESLPSIFGNTYYIESGLGGVFTVKSLGLDDKGKLEFVITNEGWEKRKYHLTPAEAAEQIFTYSE